MKAELNSGDLIFELNNEDFLNRTESAVAYLADIAQKARESNAFFFNNSSKRRFGALDVPQMRNAVPGFRLRGNIELANQISIRLRVSAE